jgi:hypothetical protein
MLASYPHPLSLQSEHPQTHNQPSLLVYIHDGFGLDKKRIHRELYAQLVEVFMLTHVM